MKRKVFLFLYKLILLFSRHIKLMKIDSKDIYNVTKYLYFK